ncbi:LysR family transcriptional regulator [Mesorhizobium sp. B2-6-4]|uniref:LysR family transcriptional regulator n=1 Tax=Mesorhizobium sp. B2-6-4 TaxID=2589913 RepID=UPI0015E33686|nr:LysR family transcriptional regulator [Mesorhizobium sp. B2-6-4]
MERLNDLEAFLVIVEKGTQAAAARHLRRSLQSVNRSLAAVEASVGVQLIRRSTRSSEPTEVGLDYYNSIKSAFADIVRARDKASSQRDGLTGLLTIGAPHLFASAHVAPAICDFMQRYPGIEVELKTADEQVDVIAAGLDLAVRIGKSSDEGLIARQLGGMRVVVVGAASYFAVHGKPNTPTDLTSHECVLRAGADPIAEWPFATDGRELRVKLRGKLRTNSASVMRSAMAKGLGIARLPYWQVEPLVRAGEAEIVLATFEPDRIPMQIVWSPTGALLERVRKLIDFLATRLKSQGF